MKGAPRSKEFDDVYFCAEDGLAETQYVFLQGNNLPQGWRGRGTFVIAETGFGTGLNVLSAIKLFRETALGKRLHIVSFEKYPLGIDEIRDWLAPWRVHFGPLMDDFLAVYPLRIPGFHRVVLDGGVELTLIFDDVNIAMPQVQGSVDCWFLDGFKPATNPEMWTETVFENMARLSAPGATFATFTSVGAVKRGLRAAGFDVKKIKGFGTKWSMLTGVRL